MCLAVPGKIVSIVNPDPVLQTGKVSFSGIIKEVSLACVPEAKIDDYVAVHAGFALSIVDEAEAKQIFKYLEQMNELNVEDPIRREVKPDDS
jgi:hydrogenase expression/formation protein HypC